MTPPPPAADATTAGGLVGIRVNVDGSIEDVPIAAGPDGIHVEGLQAAVGAALFDIVGLPDGIDVFVDDEGLYTASYNRVLSAMVGYLRGSRAEYRLHGAGEFLSTDTGDTLALTRAQRVTVAAAWFTATPLAML